MSRRAWLTGATYVVVWLVLAVAMGVVLFLQSSRTTTVASHDAVVSPDFSGQVVLRTGPVLPDVRIDSGSRVGVDIELGKTDAESTSVLLQRYAYIASQPEGQVAKIERTVRQIAVAAAVRGAALGSVPALVWLLIGPARRRELLRSIPTRRGGLVLLVLALGAVGIWAPWQGREETLEEGQGWMPLAEFLGPDVPLPAEVEGVEVLGDVTTDQTRRLIESAVDTYERSQEFYATAAADAAKLDLRTPEEGDTVVALVSDRHDNIGMDAVARAVADAGGASAVFDAGDDTSTGRAWEAFSLDSVTAAFEGYDGHWAVAGNHDNGDFVTDYLDDLGWTMLDGEVVDGPGDTRLLGVDDPRSSGLGTWRDETGLSFDEVRTRIADAACAADEDDDRVDTILVHDANLGSEALERGCTDLVLGGHVHVQEGPEEVIGENDAIGYTYATGTTGGAAYAIAVGSKIRRPAQVTLVTYADGRPAGLQPVTLQTNGRIDVDGYVELVY